MSPESDFDLRYNDYLSLAAGVPEGQHFSSNQQLPGWKTLIFKETKFERELLSRCVYN